MKNKLLLYISIYLCLLPKITFGQKNNQPSIFLNQIHLNDLSEFKKTSKNWGIAKNATVDRTQKETVITTEGKGILINKNNQKKNKNLVTKFQHGDLELELDVLIPKGSTSGIYLQGRYEIQLSDSWNHKKLTINDIGSINQGENFKGQIALKNGAKVPGVWQHLKIIFHAPKFDKSGTKVKNAWFEEVTLNTMVVLKNTEVPTPTDGTLFKKEKALGPLVLQASNGSIAFKNINYKLNKYTSLTPQNIIAEIKKSRKTKDIASIKKIKAIKTKSVKTIAPLTDLKKNAKNLIVYSGTFNIPETADYLFTMFVNGGAFLAIGDKVIHSFGMSTSGHENTVNHPKSEKCSLQKGKVPFIIAYNKNSPRRRGFELYAEGEHMQKHSLIDHKMSQKDKRIQDMRFILLEKNNKTRIQRSFLIHKDRKRRHCISVGHPGETNYSYDLAIGSLLQIWNGDFLNATHMWYGRGAGQLAYPEGPVTPFHGDVNFAFLKNKQSKWPVKLYEDIELEQKGYKLDKLKNPTFLREIKGTKITDKFVPSNSERKLTREITTVSKKEIWHKITEADDIEILTDGTYLILNQNLLIDFKDNGTTKPIIRSKGKLKELVVKIPSGKQKVNYDIIW